jgi:TorA maturation chaperone TorD
MQSASALAAMPRRAIEVENRMLEQQDDDRSSACARFCRTLARCYEVDAAALAAERGFDRFIADARDLEAELGQLAEALIEVLPDDDATTLAADFERLFIGAPRMLAPPCGSIWLDGANCVIGVSTLGVIGLFRDGDFDLEDAFIEPPDHIAAELQFLHRLMVRQHDAERTGDSYTLNETRTVRRRLFDAHLSRWVEPFCQAIAANAQTRFYRTLGALTSRFMKIEAAACDSLVAAR